MCSLLYSETANTGSSPVNFTDLNSSPGSVTQVRECTNAILRCSKAMDIPAILVGHVNKDGAIAGPKVLEHIVDIIKIRK